jgi:thiazole biosynthesis/tRNA modification protein ThiI
LGNTQKEVLLLKYGELILKGLNRSYFEGLLMKDIKYRMEKCGNFGIRSAQSTIYITPLDQDAVAQMDKAYNEAKKVFGIASICRAAETQKDFEKIKELLPIYTKEKLQQVKTFKIDARRSDKKFPFDSPAICRECGSVILDAFPHLTVDVNNPEISVRIEIRDFAAYIHCGAENGAGGMPIGSAGKGILLLSGGIDSPVAGYLMAKRGVTIEALHFESFPYTSEKAREKVVELATAMKDTCGKITLTVISVTKIQEAIKRTCREDYFTLILRRFMMRLSEKTANHYGSKSLITGESLGQVASQTMGAIGVTNNVVATIPVFRPLIASDKEDIVKIARKIGTFDISILPYEDCCTVFTPKHPVTNPTIENILVEEENLDIDALVKEAFEQRYSIKI